MKKIVAFILMFMMSMTVANAAEPDFLYDVYNNYTAASELSVSFESSDDIAALLEEMDIPEEISNFADIKSLLKSLFTLNTKMNIQADISEDYKEIKLALTSDGSQKIDFNKNLNINVNTKTGMWININLKEEKYEIIYSLPAMNKYFKIDVSELITNEEEKQVMFESLNTVFNKDYIEELQKISAELIKKHADIKISGTKCIIKIDNDALIKMINDLIPIVFESINETLPEDARFNEEIPHFEGIKILDDEGITYTYSLLSGKVSKIDMKTDISINISEIAESFGEPWMFNSKGILDFKIESSTKISKINKTKVTFPSLTKDNSISLKDLMPAQEETPSDFEYEPEYPNYYISISTEKLIITEDDIYVPLRATFENAYGDTVQIGYDSGVITVSSEHFDGFDTLKVSAGSDKAYLDAVEYQIDKVIVQNGISYISTEAFEKLFGWETAGAYHDILENIYTYSFFTMS